MFRSYLATLNRNKEVTSASGVALPAPIYTALIYASPDFVTHRDAPAKAIFLATIQLVHELCAVKERILNFTPTIFRPRKQRQVT
jgi:hypothetical protein